MASLPQHITHRQATKHQLSISRPAGRRHIKAKFQFEFPNDEAKEQVVDIVSSYFETGAIEWMQVDNTEQTMKFEGDFDAQELLHKLRSVCKTGVVVYEKTFSSMPATN